MRVPGRRCQVASAKVPFDKRNVIGGYYLCQEKKPIIHKKFSTAGMLNQAEPRLRPNMKGGGGRDERRRPQKKWGSFDRALGRAISVQ